ncbi:MAG: GAF domain-containing protein [Candidatus Methylomirabilales bacterium]
MKQQMDMAPQEIPAVSEQADERLTLVVTEKIPSEIREQLEALQETTEPPVQLFEKLTGSLAVLVAEEFSLQDDEVAILLLKDEGLTLRFACPNKLYAEKTNAFPVNIGSIAGQVLLTKKGRIDNYVADTEHLSIYERIFAKADRPWQIQKMISVPLVLPDGQLLGVLQVSRKAKSQLMTPDFIAVDLSKLNDLIPSLASYIKKVIPVTF